jgi:hypothetical protein
MSTIALLAQLQERAGLSQLGPAELKAIGVLEELLGGTKRSSRLPFAVAAFLLDEAALAAAVAAGVVAAKRSWIAAARKPRDLQLHWNPRRHPDVPSFVTRALGIAEAARNLWVESDAGEGVRQPTLGLVWALADDWAKNGKPAPARLKDVVTMIVGSAAPARRPAAKGPEWLVSVSIDIGGSTEAKTRLKNLNPAPDPQKNFLRRFYRQFLQKEMRFYDHLTKIDEIHRLSPLALEQIFYVKGIGDEVWLLIEPRGFDREHLLHLLARLLKAAEAALSTPIFIAETGIEEGPHFDPAEAERAIESGFERLQLPFKVFIDKVDGAYSIAEQRASALVPWLNGAVHDGRVAYGDFAKVANRIGVGMGALTAGTWRNAIRTDYIGHEIDRLFRAAKAARPLLVTVGQNLLDIADPDAALIADGSTGIRSLMVRCDPRSDSASRGLTFHVRPETIPAAEMKGIEEDYRVYHYFDPGLLRTQFAQAGIERRLAGERAAIDPKRSSALPQFVSDMEKLRNFMNDPSLDPAGTVGDPAEASDT